MPESYSLSYAELIDRMNIVELKIIHSDSEEAKAAFQKEMQDILSDLSQYSKDALIIRAACVLAMVNISIWNSEDSIRKGTDGKILTDEEKIKLADQLLQSHKLNSDRAFSKKRIQQLSGGRLDEKLNYVSGLWNIKY